MQLYIGMIMSLVLSLASGRYPQHVKEWGKYLIPLRDVLNQVYPVDTHAAGDVAPPLPSTTVQHT